jgi:HlyD family secretion protein
MPKIRLRLIIVLAALGLVFLALPIMRIILKKKGDDNAGLRAPVVLATAERRDLSLVLSYAGILTPESTITILPKIPGRVERLLPKEGSYVKKGDLLAVIDDEVVSLQAQQAKSGWEAARAQSDKAKRGVRPQELENAKSSLAQAEKDLEAAEAIFARTKRLYEGGTVSKTKYEEAENALRSARTQVDNGRRSVSLMEEGASREDQDMAAGQAGAMKAQYDLALLQAGYARVTSPASGRVVKVMAEAGNMVGQTSPLMIIAQDKSMTAQVAVPERHYGKFLTHPGTIRVLVRPIAFRERAPFEGTVASVAQAVDPQSRSFLVDVSVDNSEGLLRSGMYVDADMSLDRIDKALCVPEAAVLRRGGESIIFIYEEEVGAGGRAAPGAGEGASRIAGLGRIKRVTAKTGMSADGWIQVLSGVEAGQRVVTEGNAFLEGGQEVRAVESE